MATELSKELARNMDEAAGDAAWAEKLHSAAAWEGYAALLGDKDIEPSAELKGAFEAAHPCISKALGDDDLERLPGA